MLGRQGNAVSVKNVFRLDKAKVSDKPVINCPMLTAGIILNVAFVCQLATINTRPVSGILMSRATKDPRIRMSISRSVVLSSRPLI